MSRVVRFHRLGGPEVLQIEELPDRPLNEGELRVRVEAIGLNRAEQMFRSGAYLEQAALPAHNGYEASAVVLELGPGVSGFAVGEPVSVIPAFSLNAYGVYAEVAVVPAYAVGKRPKGLSAIDAAACLRLPPSGRWFRRRLTEASQVCCNAGSFSATASSPPASNANTNKACSPA